MAIDKGTETLAIKTEERTWRTNIETPYGSPPVVTVWREIVKTDPKGNVISKENIGESVIDPDDHADIVQKVEAGADKKRAAEIVKADEATAEAINENIDAGKP